MPTRQRPTEILDEHYYSLPEFFMANAFRYDTYDRKGSHIYVGEYAVTQNAGQGNLRAAVGEAAFMTGMERNADVVVMSSYAPCSLIRDGAAGTPTPSCLMPRDAYGTPSYHVQAMFAQHRPDVVLPARVEVTAAQHQAAATGRLASGPGPRRPSSRTFRSCCDGKILWAFDPQRGLQDWEVSSGDWEVRGRVPCDKRRPRRRPARLRVNVTGAEYTDSA